MSDADRIKRKIQRDLDTRVAAQCKQHGPPAQTFDPGRVVTGWYELPGGDIRFIYGFRLRLPLGELIRLPV